MSDATQVLREYGQAIRGGGSEIDGRGVKGALETIADWVDEPEKAPALTVMRDSLGICPSGRGHWSGTWYGYCDETCVEPDDE